MKLKTVELAELKPTEMIPIKGMRQTYQPTLSQIHPQACIISARSYYLITLFNFSKQQFRFVSFPINLDCQSVCRNRNFVFNVFNFYYYFSAFEKRMQVLIVWMLRINPHITKWLIQLPPIQFIIFHEGGSKFMWGYPTKILKAWFSIIFLKFDPIT